MQDIDDKEWKLPLKLEQILSKSRYGNNGCMAADKQAASIWSEEERLLYR